MKTYDVTFTDRITTINEEDALEQVHQNILDGYGNEEGKKLPRSCFTITEVRK